VWGPGPAERLPSLLLIRHAQASFGAEDYDVLSEFGHDQVRALVAGLQARGIRAARVVCGDLRRQRDTAAPCAEAFGVPLAVDPRFNEYVDRDVLTHHATVPAGLDHHSGDATLSSREFQDILNAAVRGWIAAGAQGPAQETWPAFLARGEGALNDLATSLGRGEVGIAVSSGGVIAALTAALLGLAPESMIAFNHVSINASITKLTVGRAGVRVISVNEHAHLESGEGSLVTYR
jgi:broad specificity phosphatase PhoE